MNQQDYVQKNNQENLAQTALEAPFEVESSLTDSQVDYANLAYSAYDKAFDASSYEVGQSLTDSQYSGLVSYATSTANKAYANSYGPDAKISAFGKAMNPANHITNNDVAKGYKENFSSEMNNMPGYADYKRGYAQASMANLASQPEFSRPKEPNLGPNEKQYAPLYNSARNSLLDNHFTPDKDDVQPIADWDSARFGEQPKTGSYSSFNAEKLGNQAQSMASSAYLKKFGEPFANKTFADDMNENHGPKAQKKYARYMKNSQNVAKGNFGKFFDDNPKYSKKLNIYSGNQMKNKITVLTSHGNRMMPYLSDGTKKAVQADNKRLQDISAKLNPNKAYTGEMLTTDSKNVKPLSYKGMAQNLHAIEGSNLAHSNIKLHNLLSGKYNLSNKVPDDPVMNRVSQDIDGHPARAKGSGLYSTNQASKVLKAQMKKNEPDVAKSRMISHKDKGMVNNIPYEVGFGVNNYRDANKVLNNLKPGKVYNRDSIDKGVEKGFVGPDTTAHNFAPETFHDIQARTYTYNMGSKFHRDAQGKSRGFTNAPSINDIKLSMKKNSISPKQLDKLSRHTDLNSALANNSTNRVDKLLGVTSGRRLLNSGVKYTADEGHKVSPKKVYNTRKVHDRYGNVNGLGEISNGDLRKRLNTARKAGRTNSKGQTSNLSGYKAMLKTMGHKRDVNNHKRTNFRKKSRKDLGRKGAEASKRIQNHASKSHKTNRSRSVGNNFSR